MDPKSQVAEGLELKKRGEVTISQPWQRHPPGGTPKDHPVGVPRALGSHRPPGPRDPTSPRRPAEDWARAGGARREGPAAGQALGEGSSRLGPAQGARSREPRRAAAKVSLPAPHREGLSPGGRSD